MPNADDDTEYVAPSEGHLLARLQEMSPEAFERLVADVWERLGWHTRVVGEPGDRGIDVIATRGEQKQLIQAKRYGTNTSVGSPEVQQYASLRLQEDSVDTVTIVTTGTFTEQAHDLATDLNVVLVNGADLLNVCEEAEAWDVIAAYFEEFTVADGEAPDVRGLPKDERRGWAGTAYAAWRTYKRLRRLF